MKILLLSSAHTWGGGEQQLRLLARGLVARGHEVKIACRAGSVLFEEAKSEQLPAFELPGHPKGLRAIWHTRRLISSWQPDVISANDSHAVSLLRFATLGNRCPVQVAARRVPYATKSPGKYSRGADLVICVSRAIRDATEESGVPANQLSVVYSGIDFERMQAGDAARGRASLNLEDDIPMVLVVASLLADKGHRVIVEAASQLREAIPQVQIYFAGEGSEREPLEAQIAAANLGDTIHLLGFRQDIADLMHAANVFCMPSLNEGLGTSAIDALAIAKPTVASNVGGLPEILRNSDTGNMHGWLVPADEPIALADALHEALINQEEAECRAAAGREHVLAQHSVDAMIEGTLAEYNRLLAKR